MNASRTYTSLVLAIAAVTGLSLPVALPVYANPEGATVVSGEASIQQIAPGQLEIRNSAGAIINWHDFSVGEGEATRFIQPSAASAVLNRVVGQNPSQILGQLASNGRVFLINQNGIVFGAGAKIDTAGLVASTLNITDEDFLAGRLQFEGGNGKIDNYGILQAGPGGEIVLIAPEVTNHGVLSVVGGQLILAAGQKVRLASLNIDDVTVEVRAPANQALNLGQLIAERGAIGLLGGTVTNNGLISATSLSRDAQGRVVLSASGSLGLGRDSSIDVSGVRGGDIRLTANDTALVRGSLNATGTTGTGGSIDITALNTGLFGDVRIDASGAAGGGRVRVGGGFQGQASDIANATHTVVQRGARITANATQTGRGGEVVLWADDSMRFMGDISARGGLQSGNGGNVEVSGHQRLGFDGTVDVGAFAGLSGQILLDPNNGTIVTGSAASPEAADGVILFGDAAGTDLTISEGALEALTGNVDLQFQQNLTVNSGVALNFTNQTNGELVSLRAGGNLTLNGGIVTNGADLLLSAGDSGATSPLATATLAIGSVPINVTNAGGTGNVTLRSGGSGGIALSGSTFTLSSGTLTFNTAGAQTITSSTINGGTLLATGTTTSLTSGVGSNTLSNVTLGMDFIVPTSGNLRTSNGLTVASGRTLHLAGNSSLTTTTNETYSGPGTIQFEGTNSITGTFGGQVLNLNAGLTIQGLGTGGGNIGQSFFTINNTGTIQANSGQTITATNIVNQTNSVLRANAGTLNLAGTSSNPGGTLDLINAGTLNLTGTISNFGTLNRPGGNGTININGTLNNTGNTFVFNDTTGVINLAGGTISGGTLQKSGSGDLILTANSSLSGVTLDMDFIIPTGRNIRTGNGLTVASGRTLHLAGNSSLTTTTNETYSGPGTIQFEGTNSITGQFGGQTLTLASGLRIATLAASTGTVGAAFMNVINQGSIRAGANSALTFAGSTATNNGSLVLGSGATLNWVGSTLANNGTLDIGPSGTVSTNNVNLTNNGTISGNGRIDLTTDASFEDLINNGTLRPGASPGLLTIDGDLILNGTSVLDLEVQGRARARQYDAIDVLGTALLAGTLNVTHLTPYVPVDGHTFRVLTSTGARTGTFTTVNTPVPYNTQYVVGNNVLLQVGSTPQSVNFWLTNTSGNYATGSNWSLGSAPVAGQIVIIDRTGSAPTIITVNSAGQVSGNLLTTNTLNIDAAGFTVTDASLVDLTGKFT